METLIPKPLPKPTYCAGEGLSGAETLAAGCPDPHQAAEGKGKELKDTAWPRNNDPSVRNGIAIAVSILWIARKVDTRT